MKKFFTIVISLVLLLSVAIAPVYAGGDKNQGDVGVGEVDQGDTGSDTGKAVSGAVKMMYFRRFENVCILRGSRTLSAATRTGLC